jgi:hypothetical protein
MERGQDSVIKAKFGGGAKQLLHSALEDCEPGDEVLIVFVKANGKIRYFMSAMTKMKLAIIAVCVQGLSISEIFGGDDE